MPNWQAPERLGRDGRKRVTQDKVNPKAHRRSVAGDVNTCKAQYGFCAATPPLDTKKGLLSRWAKDRIQDGESVKLHARDVRKRMSKAPPPPPAGVICVDLPPGA